MNKAYNYATILSKMVQEKTVSTYNQTDLSAFYRFHDLLRTLFPNVFSVCKVEDFNGSLLLRWKGKDSSAPILFMNHFDVVGALGNWSHDPFGGEIIDGKLWGRGTLDTKGGLFCMLQACEELIKEGFVPSCDIYFESACTEECAGEGCDNISQELKNRGIRFQYVLDEGGMIIHDPIGGADGDFAMIGVGEKNCSNVKFSATSNGGHASAPKKNSPLIRLSKFMLAVEKTNKFTKKLSPVTKELFRRSAQKMKGPLKFVLGHPSFFAPLLTAVLPMFSATASAMLKTTVAFTMASGSDAYNSLPDEAYVIANVRVSHHQGDDDTMRVLQSLAKKYDIKMEIVDQGLSSPLSSHTCTQYLSIEKAVKNSFPEVICAPYITNTASDTRFMARVCDNCYHFTPFFITDKQLEGIHGIDENIDIANLTKGVEFYKYLMKE